MGLVRSRAAAPLLLALPLLLRAQTQQELDDGVIPLQNGVALAEAVNPFSWHWYALPLGMWEDSDDGPHEVTHNVVVTVDATSTIYIAGEENWAAFDAIIFNGTLPENAGTGDPGPFEAGNPVCWFDEVCDRSVFSRVQESSRITLSLGFNASADDGQTGRLSTAYIGVREAGLSTAPVEFTVRARRLPKLVRDGDVIVGAVPPCWEDDAEGFGPTCSHYYSVELGGFDVFRVDFERRGAAPYM